MEFRQRDRRQELHPTGTRRRRRSLRIQVRAAGNWNDAVGVDENCGQMVTHSGISEIISCYSQ